MTAEYPRRPAFWANRLMRLMHKSCAANELGIEACWLVCVIVQVEDAKRYNGAVTFFNSQLLPMTGFTSWGRLDRARKKAVEGGWLHYEAGLNRKAGKYWTTVPDSVLDGFDDTPAADEIPETAFDPLQNGESQTRTLSKMERQTVIEPRGGRSAKRGANGEPSIPTPRPIPEEEGVPRTPAASATSKPKKRNPYPQDFEAFWSVYPKQRRKRKSRRSKPTKVPSPRLRKLTAATSTKLASCF